MEKTIVLKNGRVITNPAVIELVEAFDKLKLEDFQPLIPNLRDKWNVPEEQEIIQRPIIESVVVTKQTEFDAVLTAVSADRINTIKLVREMTGTSLAESRAVLDKLPFVLKSSISEAEVQGIADKFKTVGAIIEAK